jgi:iron-sulfur cluster repair protein YtfE (RIC family)
MTKSDRFREQHDELLGLANALLAELDADKLATNAASARSVLNKLTGKLMLHLGAEDRHLYPDLLESPDAETRKLARQFVDEMGGIADTFVEYTEKWRMTGNIQSDVNGFIVETRDIYQALTVRIDKENRLLYPLMDRRAA